MYPAEKRIIERKKQQQCLPVTRCVAILPGQGHPLPITGYLYEKDVKDFIANCGIDESLLLIKEVPNRYCVFKAGEHYCKADMNIFYLGKDEYGVDWFKRWGNDKSKFVFDNQVRLIVDSNEQTHYCSGVIGTYFSVIPDGSPTARIINYTALYRLSDIIERNALMEMLYISPVFALQTLRTATGYNWQSSQPKYEPKVIDGEVQVPDKLRFKAVLPDDPVPTKLTMVFTYRPDIEKNQILFTVADIKGRYDVERYNVFVKKAQ